MSLRTTQGGDSSKATPGTCNQTGNHAPKFPWSFCPIGRTARITVLVIAYYLDYTDDSMATNHKFPSREELGRLFVKLMPWFPAYYDEVRKVKAQESGYVGPLEAFNYDDCSNRLRYCFAKPGSRKHTKSPRLYGYSVEHPKSVEQQKLGGRGEVFVRCSEEILNRLKTGRTITRKEAEAWGS